MRRFRAEPSDKIYSADERARKAGRTVREFLKYENIEKLADDLADFLDYTSRLDDLNDYLDEYDIEHIGAAVDALYDFAKAVGSER